MTDPAHVYPSWLLTVQTADGRTFGDPGYWYYGTWEGEEVTDPDAPVRLAGVGFSYSWSFDGEALPPTKMEPAQVTFKLSLASAADMPAELREGYIVRLALARPHGVPSWVPGSGITVTPLTVQYLIRNNFRVRDMTSRWDPNIRRLIVTVSCVDLSIDLNSQIAMDGWNWDSGLAGVMADYAARGPIINEIATMYFAARGTPVAAIVRWHPDANPADIALTTLSYNDIEDSVVIADLIEMTNAPEFGPGGRKFIPCVVGARDQLPFNINLDITPDNLAGLAAYSFADNTLHDDHTGYVFLGDWTPSTTLSDPPFELAIVAGKVASVRDNTAVLENNAGLIVLSASQVAISPDWRRAVSRSVNQVIWTGRNTDTGNERTTTINNPSAQAIDGLIVRKIESVAVLAGTGTRLTSNAHAHYLYDLYTSSSDNGSPWAPDGIEVLTHLMNDAQLDSYLPRFLPREHMQQTVLLVDIEEEANPAQGPVWATLNGCDVSIDNKGRLVVKPSLVPYLPPVDSTATVTWNDFNAGTYAGKTWADPDPALTWAQIGVTHV